MRPITHRQVFRAIAPALLLVTTFGCGGTNPDSMLAEANSSNIKRLATLYAKYQTNHNWRGPKDEAALMAFIQQQDNARLQRIGVDKSNLDQLFTSERDQQKFQIRWGVKSQARGPSEPVVFETAGVNGIRQVGFTGGQLEETDSAKYDLYWKGEGVIASQGRPDGAGRR